MFLFASMSQIMPFNQKESEHETDSESIEQRIAKQLYETIQVSKRLIIKYW